jgi:hypothetical protein
MIRQSPKDQEIYLGSPSNYIGFIKKTGNNSYKVVGDGLFSFLSSKSINIKTVEELTLSHIFIENLKSKKVLTIL